MRPAAGRPRRRRHQGRAARAAIPAGARACSPIRRGRRPRRACRGGSRTGASRRWCSTSTTPPVATACSSWSTAPTSSSSRSTPAGSTTAASASTRCWPATRSWSSRRSRRSGAPGPTPAGRPPTSPSPPPPARCGSPATPTAHRVRLSAPQLFLHAGVEAAVHTLVALWHAQTTGAGQHVDVSAQLCGVRCLMNAQAYHVLEGRELFRIGPVLQRRPLVLPGHQPVPRRLRRGARRRRARSAAR